MFRYRQAGVLPTPEGAGLAPRSPYAATKVALEMLAWAHQLDENGPQVGVVRFFNVYGPGERPDDLIPRLCANLLQRNELPVEGSGDQRRDFTYITDVVDKLVALADLPVLPVLNLGSGRSYSVKDVVDVLKQVSEDVDIVRKPDRPNEIMEFRADTTWQDRQIARTSEYVDIVEGTRLTLEWWPARDLADTQQRLLQEESH